jgi:hypothetical protein
MCVCVCFCNEMCGVKCKTEAREQILLVEGADTPAFKKRCSFPFMCWNSCRRAVELGVTFLHAS